MQIAIICFTEHGKKTAEKVESKLRLSGHQVRLDVKCERLPESITISLAEWTREKFTTMDAIVFVGAVGIAVRAIAPYVKRKTEDPAVLVLDEAGKYCIPILSGHIGGANELARNLAAALNAEPVITTATDLNQKWAVDVFAAKNHLQIENMNMAKRISSRILAGETIRLRIEAGSRDFQRYSEEISRLRGLSGMELVQEGPADVWVGVQRPESNHGKEYLWLIPQVAYLGLGCRKGASQWRIERAVMQALEAYRIDLSAIAQVASIDLKAKEPGILAFCEKYQLPYQVYTAEKLKELSGDYSESGFVKQVTGVDNVCERSAVCACMEHSAEYKSNENPEYEKSESNNLEYEKTGYENPEYKEGHQPEEVKLVVKKYICNGVTVAVAVREWSVDFA
jgi:cobalt-precorrin 5A hydrolase